MHFPANHKFLASLKAVFRYFVFLGFGFVSAFCTSAQSAKVWVFGNHAGIDFNTGNPVPVYTNMRTTESAASVCDASGALLFYTDGYYVWDQAHNRMPHGDSLIPFTLNNTSSSFSTAQGAIIIPVQGDRSRYYIFSLSSVENGDRAGRLYYSIVDMSLNNGKGDVVVASRAQAVDTGLTEKMTAVAGTGCCIWLVTCGSRGNFRSYRITTSGISTIPVVSPMGMGLPIGKLCVSPDRKKLGATNLGSQADGNYTGAAVFDFNPGTGQVTNPVALLTGEGAYGICLSSGGSKAYINTASRKIVQYDLGSTNPAATAYTLCATASYTSLGLGPDNKIYFHERNDGVVPVLGIISKPDLDGPACEFRPGGLSLLSGTGMSLGLPNIVPVWLSDTAAIEKQVAFPCWKDSLQLQCGAATGNVLWNTGATTRSITVGQGGTYTVTYQNGCTVFVETYRVNAALQGALPVVKTFGSCNTTAAGMAWLERRQLDNLLQVKWYKGNDLLSTADTVRGLPPGTYRLSLRLGTCDTTINVEIANAGVANRVVADTLVCLEDPLALSAAVTGPDIGLDWVTSDGARYTGAAVSHRFSTPGLAYVLLISAKGDCRDTVVQYIQVDAPGRILALDKDKSSVCAGQEITFTPRVTGDGIMGYRWHMEQQEIQKTDATPVTHTFLQSGTAVVSFTVQPRVCPAVTYRDSVLVYALPVVVLGPDTALCPGKDIVVCSPAGGAHSGFVYRWSNGGNRARMDVTAPGTYTLSVTDTNGCTGADEIRVANNCHMDIPNAFTPNGDQVNDYFFPLKELSGGVAFFTMKIFNRWGQVVFSVNGIDGQGWDGRYNNKEQPVGVYVYVIDVTIRDREPQHITGNVTLLR